ncbi:hypothetical protein B0J12DRAFT_310093 [Macrophomina phaseolina]|uniref:Zn(2)-C6 fungal-type domain-containing protein n=1 Tax=Macrophomina phaseolina TaxID=35725 RepID=A0ABQ8FWQ6_9PEZI|nr:hypothetical protein B0J12DRAFT_310093 [Macrophomina phaseolina]
MPPSATTAPTMPVVKRAGKSRLRASCDRCHQAKLRCTFDDPTACARCKKQHMPCVRSLSMPLGRTSGSRNKRKPSVSDYPTPKEFKTSPSFAGSTPPQYAADGPEAPPPVDSAPAWEDAFLDLDPTPFDLDPRFGALGLGWSDAHMLTALPDPDPATPDPPPRPDSFFSHALAGCDAHAAAAARSATEPPPAPASPTSPPPPSPSTSTPPPPSRPSTRSSAATKPRCSPSPPSSPAARPTAKSRSSCLFTCCCRRCSPPTPRPGSPAAPPPPPPPCTTSCARASPRCALAPTPSTTTTAKPSSSASSSSRSRRSPRCSIGWSSACGLVRPRPAAPRGGRASPCSAF